MVNREDSRKFTPRENQRIELVYRDVVVFTATVHEYANGWEVEFDDSCGGLDDRTNRHVFSLPYVLGFVNGRCLEIREVKDGV